MKFSRFYFLFFVIWWHFFTIPALAQQTELDSLKIKLSEAKTRNDSILLIIKLSKIYYTSSLDKDFDKAIQFLNNNIEKISDPYIKGSIFQINALKALDNKKYNIVIKNGLEALKKFETAKDTLPIGETTNMLVKSYITLDKIKEAQKLYDKYKQRIPLKYKYLILMKLAKKYISISEYNKTKNLLNEAFIIAHQLENQQYIGKALYRISQLNLTFKNYKEAELKAIQSLKMLDKNKNILLYGAAYHNLAEILEREEKYNVAIKYMDSALACYTGHPISIAIILNKKAFTLIQLNKLEDAKKTVEKAIELNKKTNNNYSLSFAYSTLASVLFSIDKSDPKAIFYMNKAIKNARKHKIKDLIKASNYNLSNMYYANGQYKKAYDKLKIAFKYSDSIYKDKIIKDVKDIETKYQTEKKERKIAQQQNIIKAKELETQKARTRNLLLIIGLLSALLIAFFIWRRYKAEAKAKRIISQQKTVIEELQKELHHRIKNNLNIIDAFVDEIIDDYDSDNELKKKLQELQNRIYSIKEVHTQLYKNADINNIDVKKYIDELANKIAATYKNKNVNIKQQIKDDLKLKGDKSFVVGLIVNEFLTNSFKYAFEKNGEIQVKMSETDDNYILQLSDNGKGLPKNFNIKTIGSYGLRIMLLLSKQLKGTFDLKSRNGVHLTIQFPKA